MGGVLWERERESLVAFVMGWSLSELVSIGGHFSRKVVGGRKIHTN